MAEDIAKDTDMACETKCCICFDENAPALPHECRCSRGVHGGCMREWIRTRLIQWCESKRSIAYLCDEDAASFAACPVCRAPGQVVRHMGVTSRKLVSAEEKRRNPSASDVLLTTTFSWRGERVVTAYLVMGRVSEVVLVLPTKSESSQLLEFNIAWGVQTERYTHKHRTRPAMENNASSRVVHWAIPPPPLPA